MIITQDALNRLSMKMDIGTIAVDGIGTYSAYLDVQTGDYLVRNDTTQVYYRCGIESIISDVIDFELSGIEDTEEVRNDKC